ncbi:speckle-type POZ protein-like [Uloborus diversus]|uniref:speckle-type POZ protein-like n=1 Tax=Uloborus diversus TaxID=327109 RepID=UPI002409F846|nr:speckle-type POZ protein-like [Uloborus diversus]
MVDESSYGPYLHRRFYGFKRISRSDLLQGKLGDVRPGDILTIHCELEVKDGDDGKDEEDTKEGSTVFILDAFSAPFLEGFQSTFENGKFSDVTLRVGEENFQCHKAILSTHSKVFEAMFDNDMKESHDEAVYLADLDVDVAKAMLLYMYTRRTEGLPEHKVLDLYVAADRYMLPELKEKCREFVLKHLSVDNVCEVAEVADLHSDDILAESVERFISSNLRKVLVSEKWNMRLCEKPYLYAKLLSVSVVRHDCV